MGRKCSLTNWNNAHSQPQLQTLLPLPLNPSPMPSSIWYLTPVECVAYCVEYHPIINFWYAFSVWVSSIPQYWVFNPTKKDSHISRCWVLLLLIIPTNNYSHKIKESHHFQIIFVCLEFVFGISCKVYNRQTILLLGMEHKIIIIIDMIFLFLCFKQLMIIKCKLLLLLSSYIYDLCIYDYHLSTV